jgi:hypothetical protein
MPFSPISDASRAGSSCVCMVFVCACVCVCVRVCVCVGGGREEMGGRVAPRC